MNNNIKLTSNTNRLRQFPSGANMNYGLNNAVTVIMYETQRTAFI